MNVHVIPYRDSDQHYKTRVPVVRMHTLEGYSQTHKRKILWRALNDCVKEMMVTHKLSFSSHAFALYFENRQSHVTVLDEDKFVAMKDPIDVVLYEIYSLQDDKHGNHQHTRKDANEMHVQYNKLYYQKLLEYYRKQMTSM